MILSLSGYNFYTTPRTGISPSAPARREMLGCLLKLNHQRYEEEVPAGLREKGSKGKKKAEDGGQMPLF